MKKKILMFASIGLVLMAIVTGAIVYGIYSFTSGLFNKLADAEMQAQLNSSVGQTLEQVEMIQKSVFQPKCRDYLVSQLTLENLLMGEPQIDLNKLKQACLNG